MAKVDELGPTKSLRDVVADTLGDSGVLASGTALYLVVGSLFLAYVGASPIDPIVGLGSAFSTFFSLATELMPWWTLPIVAASLVMSGTLRRHLWRQRSALLLSIMMCSLFVFMFGLVKNRMFLVVPFWADEPLTQLDLFLHFGHSPHDLLSWLEPLRIEPLLGLYVNSWVFLATFFPVLLIAFDGNAERRRVFTVLWMLCWVGLGNVFAIAGMSYGPIFTDLFSGGPAEAHRNVLDMLQREDARNLLATKMFLWRAYTGESPMLGSGISAFPSVHVGMATVIGLYMAMRGSQTAGRMTQSPWLTLALIWGASMIGVLYVAAYLVLSVYLGWHYAVDGYASILLICATYALLAARRDAFTPRSWAVLRADRA